MRKLTIFSFSTGLSANKDDILSLFLEEKLWLLQNAFDMAFNIKHCMEDIMKQITSLYAYRQLFSILRG